MFRKALSSFFHPFGWGVERYPVRLAAGDHGVEGDRPEGRQAMSAIPQVHGVEAPTVPGYEILRPLKEGGMGKVYLARQETLNRLVCVKVLSIPDGEDAGVWRSRFQREAEFLASVSHPHIIPIFDFGTTGGSGLPFLVTEYVEGGDLRRLMTPGQPLPTGQARAVLRQVGDALTHLHSRGLLHRDLKPENVLLTNDGLVKVGDLGIAVEKDQAGVLTRSDRGMGTVGYISPEQQYALGVDERTDQYSLAALSYELLTGRRPLGLFPPPSRLNRRLYRGVDAAILRGLAEEPKARFSSVRDFVAALDRGLSSPPWGSRKLPLVLALTFMVLCSAVGLPWVLGPGADTGDGIGPVAARPDPSRPVETKDRPAPDPTPPPPAEGASDPPARPPERSREFTRLVELRAYSIWDRGGRPTGAAGEAVKEKNWFEAERQIGAEVDARAYRIWEEQGRPTGAAGEAVRESNHRAAEAALLREVEGELRRHPIP
jgi:serine/threonine protein kinase